YGVQRCPQSVPVPGGTPAYENCQYCTASYAPAAELADPPKPPEPPPNQYPSTATARQHRTRSMPCTARHCRQSPANASGQQASPQPDMQKHLAPDLPAPCAQ